MQEEKITKTQCAMLVLKAEGDHARSLLYLAAFSAVAFIVNVFNPMWASAVLLVGIGYAIYKWKQQSGKIQYLKNKYGGSVRWF